MKINEQAPEFTTEAFHKDNITEVSLADFKGKWVVMLFYPADFTFICPTELGEFADNYAKLKEMGAEVLSVSTDTVFVYKVWYDSSETIKKIQYPMLSDPTGNICRDYGIYIDEEGLSLRATFIIDPDGKVKNVDIYDNLIGWSVGEVICKLQAV